MKTAIINKEKFIIRNDDHKKLVNRFNLNNFKNNIYFSGCPFCDRYPGCCKCPCYQKNLHGCFYIMGEILKTKDLKFIAGRMSISYFGDGKKQIKKIHKFLVEKFK